MLLQPEHLCKCTGLEKVNAFNLPLRNNANTAPVPLQFPTENEIQIPNMPVSLLRKSKHLRMTQRLVSSYWIPAFKNERLITLPFSSARVI